jgi:hypothetical protein
VGQSGESAILDEVIVAYRVVAGPSCHEPKSPANQKLASEIAVRRSGGEGRANSHQAYCAGES